MKPSFILSASMLTIFDHTNKTTLVVHAADSARYDNVISLLREQKFSEAITAAQPAPLRRAAEMTASGLDVRVVHGTLTINGKVSNIPIADHFIQKMEAGLSTEDLEHFAANLNANPSFQVRTRLYNWLAENQMPITDDGHFLAFKSVKTSLWDHHTGNTFKHDIGDVIEIPREEVDDNQEESCSYGAHFASEKYAKTFGGPNAVIVVVKVDPRDVVAIPCNEDKGRACRYVVIDHCTTDEVAAFMAARTYMESYPLTPETVFDRSI